MENNDSTHILRRAIIQLAVPSLLSILIYAISFLFVVIPVIENKIVNSEKESIKNQVINIKKVINDFYDAAEEGQITFDESKRLSLNIIAKFHDGEKDQNYFWLIDNQNNLIAHPFLHTKDSLLLNEKMSFVPVQRMVSLASEGEGGFVEYHFFKTADTTQTENKIAYVAYIEPWKWTLGAGLNHTQIQLAFLPLKKKLLLIFYSVLGMLIAAFLVVLTKVIANTKRQINSDENRNDTELQFNGLIENITGGIAIFENSDLTYINGQFRAIFNFHGELEEFNFNKFLSIPDFKLVDRYITLNPKPDYKTSEVDSIIRFEDSSKKNINLKLSYDINTGKQLAYIIVSDITEKHISDLKIRQLSQAIAQSPTSIVITDYDGKIEYVNPGFESVYGFTFNEVVGKTTRILKSGRTTKAMYEDMWQTIKDGKNWEGELINRSGKGEYVWMSTHISPLFDKEGVILNFVSVQMDITSRKLIDDELLKAKEKAESGERLKSAFIENVSHEVRTPLNAIHGFSQLFKAFIKPAEKHFKYAQLIEKNSKILLGLFEDILEFSKIEAHTIEFTEEPVNVGLLLAKLGSKYNTRNIIEHQKPIEILIEHFNEEQPFELIVDKKYFTKIFDSLVINSLKFTEEGSIRIGFAVNIDFVEFFVIDTGIGISDQDKEIVFEAFAHGTKNFVTLHKGTGLGLSITKKLVLLMGGDIWFSSEEGVGTSFHFTIPTEKLVGSEDFAVKDTRQLPFEEATLLVAEDNKHSYLLLEAMLEPTGINIIHANNGSEAVNICEKESSKIDMVLMDIMMPILDGIKATHLIKKKSDVPVYALTAVEDKAIDKEGTLFDGYLRKPIAKDLLMSTIEQVLKNK